MAKGTNIIRVDEPFWTWGLRMVNEGYRILVYDNIEDICPLILDQELDVFWVKNQRFRGYEIEDSGNYGKAVRVYLN
jgi:hypothetical protein